MAEEDQVSNIQHASSAVIEVASPAPSAEDQHSTVCPSELRKRLSERPNKAVKIDASTFGDEFVISPERAAALHGALEQSKSILIELVQEAEAVQPSGWWARFSKWSKERSTARNVFSNSIFGRQLTRDELVAEYASLWPVLERQFNLLYAETTLFGLLALRAHRTATAQSILEEVQFATSTPTALSYVMRGVMRFATAAGFLFYFIPFLVLTFLENQIPSLANVADTDSFKVSVAAVFGCLGGVVSVLMRLSEFEATKGRSKQFLLLSGTTLPLVGGIFAAVIASLLLSKIINFSIGDGQFRVWLFVVIGFLAGFSERFTRNILHVAQGQFSPPSGRTAKSHISRGSQITAGEG